MPRALCTLSILATALVVAGCTSTQVTPLQAAAERMCIQENPKVKVADFLPVLQQGFARHGITTESYQQIPWQHCPYVVTYTARRSWDMAAFLSSAEIVILGPQRQTLAKANYHLRGKGGLSLMKWQGTQTKIDPVIDELLGNAKLSQVPAPAAAATNQQPNRALEEQLRALQQQNLGYEEYQKAYRQLLLDNL